jgi:hypothetical protein
MNLPILARQIENMSAKNRELEYKIHKLELQNQQIMIIFKDLLSKYHQRRGVKLSMILDRMADFLQNEMKHEYKEESPDLIQELIKKGTI